MSNNELTTNRIWHVSVRRITLNEGRTSSVRTFRLVKSHSLRCSRVGWKRYYTHLMNFNSQWNTIKLPYSPEATQLKLHKSKRSYLYSIHGGPALQQYWHYLSLGLVFHAKELGHNWNIYRRKIWSALEKKTPLGKSNNFLGPSRLNGFFCRFWKLRSEAPSSAVVNNCQVPLRYRSAKLSFILLSHRHHVEHTQNGETPLKQCCALVGCCVFWYHLHHVQLFPLLYCIKSAHGKQSVWNNSRSLSHIWLEYWH